MIGAKHISIGICENCKRKMEPVVKFSFYSFTCNFKGTEYNSITLCEDCAFAIADLFRKSRIEGDDFKYDFDEITRIDETIDGIE